MKEWFGNEDFWIDMYDFLFPVSVYKKAEEEVKDILALTAFNGNEILDLCCGPGRHAIKLAEEGYNVTAVDKSPYLLNIAKDRCKKDNVNVRFIEEDMRKFSRPGKFDLVINLFTSFGYFEHQEDDEAVLKNIFESLIPGGKVVMELMGKEILARIFQKTISTQLENSSVLIQRHKIMNDWSKNLNEWILLKENTYKKYSFSHRIYSAVELKSLYRAAGFNKIKVYGSLKGTVYDEEADRLVIVAEK